MFDAITDIPGIKVGHYTDLLAATGCTVILCEQGAVAGVDVRGSAPGTRETDLLRPMNVVERVHAIVLSGGSAFGLDAASGVMKYLEEKNAGYTTAAGRIPIVPAAVLFDLSIGSPEVRPGAEQGYEACKNATAGEVQQGCVGAGTGAMVGHLFGNARATKSGLGSSSEIMAGDIIVAALIAVNAFGDVIDAQNGQVLAGIRRVGKKGFESTINYLKEGVKYITDSGQHTTIGVIATNALLTKEQANKLAQMAQDGLARAINPCHTMLDGDTVFSLSLGEKRGDVTAIGAIAAEVVARAIKKAIMQAVGLAGIPARADWVSP